MKSLRLIKKTDTVLLTFQYTLTDHIHSRPSWRTRPQSESLPRSYLSALWGTWVSRTNTGQTANILQKSSWSLHGPGFLCNRIFFWKFRTFWCCVNNTTIALNLLENMHCKKIKYEGPIQIIKPNPHTIWPSDTCCSSKYVMLAKLPLSN